MNILERCVFPRHCYLLSPLTKESFICRERAGRYHTLICVIPSFYREKVSPIVSPTQPRGLGRHQFKQPCGPSRCHLGRGSSWSLSNSKTNNKGSLRRVLEETFRIHKVTQLKQQVWRCRSRIIKDKLCRISRPKWLEIPVGPDWEQMQARTGSSFTVHSSHLLVYGEWCLDWAGLKEQSW